VEKMAELMMQFSQFIERYCQKADELQNVRM
jgi:hypothetical protein